MKPTSLYRFYDQAGDLLYVGITSRGWERFAQHSRTKAWWPHVTTALVEHYPTRDAALTAEAEAIKTEGPMHNVQLASTGIRGWPAISEAYADDAFDEYLAEARDHGPAIRTRNDGITISPRTFHGHPIEWAALAYQLECGWDQRPTATDGHPEDSCYISIQAGRLIGFLITCRNRYENLPPSTTRMVRHVWTARGHRRQGVATGLTERALKDGPIDGWEPPFTPDGARFIQSRPGRENPDWCAAWVDHTLNQVPED